MQETREVLARLKRMAGFDSQGFDSAVREPADQFWAHQFVFVWRITKRFPTLALEPAFFNNSVPVLPQPVQHADSVTIPLAKENPGPQQWDGSCWM